MAVKALQKPLKITKIDTIIDIVKTALLIKEQAKAQA